MPDLLSFAVGVLVLLIAGGLHFLGGRALPSLGDSDADDRLFVRRRWTRRSVSAVMVFAGGAAIAAGLLGPGLAWMLLWASVPLLLAVAVFLAVADAARVRSEYEDRLPELAEETHMPAEAVRPGAVRH